ncbi:MAG: amidohydrolase family protein [Vicinamibacterales bacterium]
MRASRLAGLCLVILTVAVPADAQVVRAFVGARVMDGTGAAPIEDAVVLVEGGVVRAVGPASTVAIPGGAERVDLKGRTILPGFVNAHGHVQGTKGLDSGPQFLTAENLERQLGIYARYGVTSVLSLGGEGDPGVAIRTKPPAGRARLFAAWQSIDGQTAAETTVAVDRVAAKGVDWLKVRIDDNLGSTKKMPDEAWKAVIARGRELKLPTAAHIFYLQDAKAVLRAGGDMIAHSVRDLPVDAELVNLLKAPDVCYCPTLMREVQAFAYEATPAFFTDPFFTREVGASAIAALSDPGRQAKVRQNPTTARYKAALDQAKRNLGTLAKAGVRIAMGTDSGLPGRFQGYFEHEELALMVESGMTPMRALVAATGDAATCIRKAGMVGTLTPGARADLVVFREDPTKNIRATKTIESVWIDGTRVN